MNRTTKVIWGIRIALLSLCVYFLISSIYHFGEYKYWSGMSDGYTQGIIDGQRLGYYEGYFDRLLEESQSLINLTMGC